jgi:PAS domain S-box-containing protein
MAELREPAELLDAFSRSADAVFAVDQQMRVVYWNAAAERTFGIDAGAALGRRCDEIVGGAETSGAPLCVPDCRIMGCARRGHAAETYDLVRRDVDGVRQWINVSIIVLRGPRRRSTIAVHLARDVTEKRRVEQRTALLLDDLQAAIPRSSPRELTRREAEVLRMLACGASNRAIAEALGISPATVRNHTEHVMAKLGVHSKLEAVIHAARIGML